MQPPAPRPAPRPGAALRVGLATLVSRLLGVAREVVFAALLGAGATTDAFVTAFRLPNLARDLFAEGALSAGLLPAFAEAERGGGPAAAARLFHAVLGAVLCGAGAVTLGGLVLAPQLVRALAPGFAPDQAAFAVTLARLMMPCLLLVSGAAAAMALLQALGRFGTPALAPALFNVGTVGVGLGLWAAGAGPRAAALGWAWGTLLGGALQLAAQLPALLRAGWRPRLPPGVRSFRSSFRKGHGDDLTPLIARAARQALPAVVGLAALQVNLLVGNAFASRQQGGVSWLGYAFPLVQLPLGIFGLAVASVAGAGVARSAADRDAAGARAGVGEALRAVAFLGLPSTAGLMVLAGPIVALLYQRHAFGPADAAATARALVAYALGLHAYAVVKVLAPAFYALHGARLPVLASALAMIVNVAACALLQPRLGHVGVAWAASLSAAVDAGVLAVAWRRRHGPSGAPLGLTWRALAATAAAAAVAWAAEGAVGRAPLAPGLGRQAALALVPVALAAAAYLAAALALALPEARALLRALPGPRGAAREPPAG